MNSFFIAALSFVGVLGSAAGAMAVNADTLGHSNADALTQASSQTLVPTAEVSGEGSSLSGAPNAVDATGPAPNPSAVTSISISSIDGTTSGSSAVDYGNPQVATPKASQPGPASGPHAVTSGSSAVPQPTNGNPSANPVPAQDSDSSQHSNKKRPPKKEDHNSSHEEDESDANESDD